MIKRVWIYSLTFFLAIACQMTKAQEAPCGYGPHSFSSSQDSVYRLLAQNLQKSTHKRSLGNDTVLVIPVVFHCMVQRTMYAYPNRVKELLNQLNLDFRRLNADTSNLRDIFRSRVADARIEFVFADSTPDGKPFSGYHFKKTYQTFGMPKNAPFNTWHKMKFDSLGGLNAWPTDQYLNIWICDLKDNQLKTHWAGFATAPPNSRYWSPSSYGDSFTDGVVLDIYALSSTGRTSTLTHEVGHYLGLRHVSGDAGISGTGDCPILATDFIDDTPKVQAQNYNCDPNINSCDEGPDDMPDMIENYMDYTGDYCRNSFTKGQIAMMYATLEYLRPGLAKTNIVKAALSKYDKLKVYPVPFDHDFIIEVPGMENDSLSFQIFSIDGKIVYRTETYQNGQILEAEFLDAGVYFLRIKLGDEWRVEKILKLN